MTIRPDFSKFTNLSVTKKGGDSEVVWREFLIAAFSFINHCSYKVNEEELSNITISLQNWTFKRKHRDFKDQVNKGEIFLADLGLNNELAYCHPVLILNKDIEGKVLVLPVTSTPHIVEKAFHPIASPTGLRKYRKVFKNDGFDVDSAIIIDELRIINKGRLIEKKGSLNEDINLPNSIFQEVNEAAFKLLFNDFYQEKLKMEQKIAQLNEEIESFERKKIEQISEI